MRAEFSTKLTPLNWLVIGIHEDLMHGSDAEVRLRTVMLDAGCRACSTKAGSGATKSRTGRQRASASPMRTRPRRHDPGRHVMIVRCCADADVGVPVRPLRFVDGLR